MTHHKNSTPLNDLGDHQLAWAYSKRVRLYRVGWGEHLPLEDMALLASEVGEAINEVRGTAPTPEFGEELADVILRAAGIARKYGVDLDAQVARKQAINTERGNRGRHK